MALTPLWYELKTIVRSVVEQKNPSHDPVLDCENPSLGVKKMRENRAADK